MIAALALTACGKTPKAGKNPRATVEAYEAALRDGNGGAIYDMLSQRARGALDGKLTVARKAWMARGGLGLFNDSNRDVLTAAMDRGYRDVSAMQFVILDIKEYGDRARVKLSTLYKGYENERTLRLKREGAVWKLDNENALDDFRLQLMPPALPVPDP